MMRNDHGARPAHRGIVHTSEAEAKEFVGALGQITHLHSTRAAPFTSPEPLLTIVQTRAHDGKTPGGALVGYNDSKTPDLPFSRALSLTVHADAQGTPVIEHDFGYYPTVQLLDPDGFDLSAGLRVMHLSIYSLRIAHKTPVKGAMLLLR